MIIVSKSLFVEAYTSCLVIICDSDWSHLIIVWSRLFSDYSKLPFNNIVSGRNCLSCDSVKMESVSARMQEKSLCQSMWAISNGWPIKLPQQSAHQKLMPDQPSLDMAGIPRTPWACEPPEKPWTLNPFSLCRTCLDPRQTLPKPRFLLRLPCTSGSSHPINDQSLVLISIFINQTIYLSIFWMVGIHTQTSRSVVMSTPVLDVDPRHLPASAYSHRRVTRGQLATERTTMAPKSLRCAPSFASSWWSMLAAYPQQ